MLINSQFSLLKTNSKHPLLLLLIPIMIIVVCVKIMFIKSDMADGILTLKILCVWEVKNKIFQISSLRSALNFRFFLGYNTIFHCRLAFSLRLYLPMNSNLVGRHVLNCSDLCKAAHQEFCLVLLIPQGWHASHGSL